MRLGELVATGDEDRRAFTHMDLRMLVYRGRRERTLEEFTALIGAAGCRLPFAAEHDTEFTAIAKQAHSR